jgi:CRP-like cAMP-binding protein
MNVDELKDLHVFKNVPGDVLDLFPPLLKAETFEAGETIFEEGSPDDRLFIIAEGEVEIRKVIDRAGGRHKLIAVLLKGDFFGEMAVFLGQSRSADAVAKTGVKTFSISRADLNDLFRENPESAVKVLESLSAVLMERLGTTTKELVTVHETGRMITAARSVDELASCVMESVFKDIGTAEAGLFVVWNEFNAEFEVVSQQGFQPELDKVLPGDDAIVGWLMEHPEPFLSIDLSADKRFTFASDPPYGGGVSAVAAPFFQHGKMTGFVFFKGEKGAFSYNHMILLSAISSYVSVAVENLHFMQEEVDRARLSQAKSSIQF